MGPYRQARVKSLLAVSAFLTMLISVNERVVWGANENTPVKTAFDISKYGFHFINDFAGEMLLDVPVVGRLNVGNTEYGLCGGMSYAALDSFFSHVNTPTTPADPDPAPASGTQLRSYIYNRQMDSLRANDAALVKKLIEWIGRPNTTTGGVTGVHVLSHREFLHKISPELDAGRPTPLVLVKANLSVAELTDINKLKGVFANNHQVVAIGYHLHRNWDNQGHNEWDIEIYDPNKPGKTQTLHSAMGIQTEQVDPEITYPTTATQTGKFRGFFGSSYGVKRPYWWTPDTLKIPRPNR